MTNRLQQCLLMLSSPHESEILAAVRAIDRLLKATGQDWHALASGIDNDNAVTPQQVEQLKQLCLDQHRTIERLRHDLDKANARAGFSDVETEDWHVLRDWCLARKHLLKPHEVKFVEGLLHWRGKLRPKQHDWLVGLCLRLRGS